MWSTFLKILGVTPEGNKTGKREAAWTLVALALILTLTAMFMGPATIQAMSGILSTLWAASIVAVAGAYKLEHDNSLLKQNYNGGDEFA